MKRKDRFLKLALLTTSLSALSGFPQFPEDVEQATRVWSFVPAAMAQDVTQAEQQYTCPMHPHYIADDPGTCPICGMDLVPMQGGNTVSAPGMEEDDRMGVTVSAEMVQSMGIRTGRVEEAIFGRKLRAFGQVEASDRLRSSVSSRVNGWITALAKNAVGDAVQRGDHLYSLYSPELIAAQQDYLNALGSGAGKRADAARRRLHLMNVAEGTLDDIARKRRVLENVPFFSETAGVVADLGVEQGAYITPSTRVMTVQSYDTVWIETAIAEKDLSKIEEGLEADLTSPSQPSWQGKAEITYIYPTVDQATRTGRVRLEVENGDGTLKPGAFVDVTFNVGRERLPAVPSEAILRSSEGAHVVTIEGAGAFRPVSVQTGISSDGLTQILSGLDVGQEIVTSGQFLISSESSLRESFSKLQKARTSLSQLTIPESDLLMVDHVLDAALYVHEALIDGYEVTPDYLQGASDATAYIAQKYRGTKLQPLMERAGNSVEALRQARTETALFDALNELVTVLKDWTLSVKADRYQAKDIHVFRENSGERYWLQIGAAPYNPYGENEAVEVPYRASPEIVAGDSEPEQMSGEGANVHANH